MNFFERNIQATDATYIHKTNHCGYTRDSSSKIRPSFEDCPGVEEDVFVISVPMFRIFPNVVVSDFEEEFGVCTDFFLHPAGL